MKTTIRQNIYQRQIELDQKTPRFKMCCSIFAPNINLFYNTWTQTNIGTVDKQVEIAVEKWNLDLIKWWRYKENFELVADMNLINSTEFTRNSVDFMEMLHKWYAVQCYFYANKEFVKTIKDDWIIEMANREKYRWRSYCHTFNIYAQYTWSKWRYYTQDSVFVHINHKDVEIDNIQWFRKFIWPNCYAFI